MTIMQHDIEIARTPDQVLAYASVLMRVVNRLILRRRIERESAESLRALRNMAEQAIAP